MIQLDPFEAMYDNNPIATTVASVATSLRGSFRNETFGRFAVWRTFHSAWLGKFHNRYRDEDCFLLANGPSLNTVDFGRLAGKHLIGLNKIHLLLERQPLDLTFHVAINHLVIEQSWQDFQKLECPSFLSMAGAAGHVGDSGNIHYISTAFGPSPAFCADPYRSPVDEGWTVTYAALQLIYFMGFEKVFIVGMDHSFKIQGTPNEEQTMTGPDASHFDPRYFQGQQWQLPDLEGSEMSYRLADFTFRRSHRSIFDATLNGKCDVFQKLNFASAVSLCRPAESG